MTRYDKWDVVLVPFPFTDLSRSKKRPAVILTAKEYNDAGDAVIGFLTSNINGPERLGDFTLLSPALAGLPLPTRFRLKIATIDVSIVIKKLGTMEENDRNGVAESIRKAIA